ncbi:MAG: hypothetical protein QM696_06020 [Steroidobacteraceae bacterium]
MLFAAGFAARRLNLLGPKQAGGMLELVLNVGLPALFISNISRLHLGMEVAVLPVAAVIIIVALLAAAVATGRQLGLQRAEQGALALCVMCINNAFQFTFVLPAWGGEGFAYLALFDFGHTLMQGTLIYVVAAAYGSHSAGAAVIARKVLAFPLLWALVAALVINVSGYVLPRPVALVLDTGGRLVLLLVVVALGVLFDARLVRSRGVVAALLLRTGLGFALGWMLAALFGLTGMARAALLLGAAGPIGFSSVVLASREGLSRDLSASAASISVLLGFVYVPLELWLLAP